MPEIDITNPPYGATVDRTFSASVTVTGPLELVTVGFRLTLQLFNSANAEVDSKTKINVTVGSHSFTFTSVPEGEDYRIDAKLWRDEDETATVVASDGVDEIDVLSGGGIVIEEMA